VAASLTIVGVNYGGVTGYQVPAKWQTGLNDAGAVGNIVGALLNGYFTPKYGHRKVMGVNLILMIAFIFIVFFAPSINILLLGEFLCCIPWGVFTTSVCSSLQDGLLHLLTCFRDPRMLLRLLLWLCVVI